MQVTQLHIFTNTESDLHPPVTSGAVVAESVLPVPVAEKEQKNKIVIATQAAQKRKYVHKYLQHTKICLNFQLV